MSKIKKINEGDPLWHEPINENFEVVEQLMQNQKRYIYKKSGLHEADAAYKSAFGEATNILLIREGSKVDAYLRVNVTDAAKLKTAMALLFKIPEGFMIDQEMRAG
ncbi:hypothetical protein ACFJYO_16320, partial [Enterococcus faecalis]